MDLDETWQVRLRPEKSKSCTFPAKSHYGFWREREKMGRRGVCSFVRSTTHHFDFRQTSHKHVNYASKLMQKKHGILKSTNGHLL